WQDWRWRGGVRSVRNDGSALGDVVGLAVDAAVEADVGIGGGAVVTVRRIEDLLERHAAGWVDPDRDMREGAFHAVIFADEVQLFGLDTADGIGALVVNVPGARKV